MSSTGSGARAADEALENIWCQAWWDASERASWALNTVAARGGLGRILATTLGNPWFPLLRFEPGGAEKVAAAAREALSALFGTGVSFDAAKARVLLPATSGKLRLVRRSFPLEDLTHA